MTWRGLYNDKSSLNLLLGRLAVSLETVETEKTHTEHTIAVLERAKTVRARDRSTTAIGIVQNCDSYINMSSSQNYKSYLCI
jgi:hypothetical protein